MVQLKISFIFQFLCVTSSAFAISERECSPKDYTKDLGPDRQQPREFSNNQCAILTAADLITQKLKLKTQIATTEMIINTFHVLSEYEKYSDLKTWRTIQTFNAIEPAYYTRAFIPFQNAELSSFQGTVPQAAILAFNQRSHICQAGESFLSKDIDRKVMNLDIEIYNRIMKR